MAASMRQDSRSACRLSAAASTTLAYSEWRRRSRPCAVRNGRGRARRRNSERPDPSLRAKRSNPQSNKKERMDCFVAWLLAMTKQESRTAEETPDGVSDDQI